MSLATLSTELIITPVGFAAAYLTPYSARGVTQTFEILGGDGSQPWLRRDVNAVLRDASDTHFRKYKSKVSCRDGETPCLDDTWIGSEVVVSCCFEFNYLTSGGSAGRPVVSGSLRVQGSFTYYRPALTMLVTGINNSFQEYPAINGWEISLEEV